MVFHCRSPDPLRSVEFLYFVVGQRPTRRQRRARPSPTRSLKPRRCCAPPSIPTRRCCRALNGSVLRSGTPSAHTSTRRGSRGQSEAPLRKASGRLLQSDEMLSCGRSYDSFAFKVSTQRLASAGSNRPRLIVISFQDEPLIWLIASKARQELRRAHIGNRHAGSHKQRPVIDRTFGQNEFRRDEPGDICR